MSNVGNYAKDPAVVLKTNLEKGYVGVRIEQGVPLLERDLNLQSELLAAVQRSIFERYIGNGTDTSGSAFQVAATATPSGTFRVFNGNAMVGGMRINIGTFNYDPNDAENPITPWKVNEDRTDIVYVDAWLAEDANFPDVQNTGDVNRRTSVRLKSQCKVRIVTGPPGGVATMPVAPFGSGHAYYKLAEIQRTSDKIQPADITDTRVVNLNLAWLVQQLNSLQADIAKIKAALAPKFSGVRQFDHAQGYPGRYITLYGYNLHLGTVTVDVTVDGVTTLGSQMNGCKPVGDLLPNALTIKIGVASGGAATFKINTGFGSVVSTDPFRMIGQVAFDPTPWSGSKTHGNQFSVAGSFFDGPNLEIECAPTGTQNWAALSFNTPTQSAVNVIAPAPGSYQIRARNDAGAPVWAVCATTLTVI
jgi:hypothetical protein